MALFCWVVIHAYLCVFLARRKQISFSSIELYDKGGKNRASLFLTTHLKKLQLGLFGEVP
jgi:hypothetical protein